MIVATVVRAAASAVLATLAYSSTNNMFQARRICSSKNHQDNASLQQQHIISVSSMEEFKSLQRKDYLALFCSAACRCPTMEELEGDWDGILMENNGRVMTGVTSFLTNVFFGRGRPWIGKSFAISGSGRNRFRNDKNGLVETEHSFDYQIEGSRLLQDNLPCVSLSYKSYQSIFSLWYTMRDELRILCLGDNTEILLGLGCMKWSGGMLNASPFVLTKVETKQKQTSKYNPPEDDDTATGSY